LVKRPKVTDFAPLSSSWRGLFSCIYGILARIPTILKEDFCAFLSSSRGMTG
jgi:hypothetical protein